jgi:hypothetical protein
MRGISAIEFIAYQAHLAYSAVLFFLNFPAQGRELDHLANAAAVIGLEKAQLSPACFGPALWDGLDARAGKGVEPLPDWDEGNQAAPDFEADQRISW